MLEESLIFLQMDGMGGMMGFGWIFMLLIVVVLVLLIVWLVKVISK